jgi:DNA repair protein RadC
MKQFAEAQTALLPEAEEKLGKRRRKRRDEPESATAGHRERMRERLLRAGPDALADYELLEMVLYIAVARCDTKALAKTLLARFGSFANVIAATEKELTAVKGIGPNGAATLKVVHAAAVRLTHAEVKDAPVLNNWDRLMDYLQAAIAREPIEHFRVLFLDTRNKLIADEAQARGTVNHTPVYPREVVRRALEHKATALILAHNHPSGDPSPSRADIEMTQAIKEAAAALEIVIHDHIIVGNGKYLSFRREGFL